MSHRHRRRGGALVVALFTLMVVTIMAGGLLQSLLTARRQARRAEFALQAEWLAESAISRALGRLSRDPAYTGETWRVAIGQSAGEESVGLAEIHIQGQAATPNRRRILVTARFPDDSVRQVTAQREFEY